MITYYFLTILLVLIFWLNKRACSIALLFGVAIILTQLPSTDADYDRYKTSYDSAKFTNQFPFFVTNSELDAEPFYKWYTSFISVISNLDFSIFLSINFVLCLSLLFVVFNKLNLKYYYSFLIMQLPVIIPTIYYFSPRSSLSYVLVVVSFFLIVRNYFWTGVAVLIFAISTHSQFLLIGALIILSYFVINRLYTTSSKNILIYKYIIISALGLIFVLFFVDIFLDIILNILSFLPSADLATSKTHYLINERKGFRITSFLSIVVYPILSYKFSVKTHQNNYLPVLFTSLEKERFFSLMLFACMMYGLSINVVYFDNPHVAGRLSRFSDYTGMALLIPLVSNTIWRNNTLNVLIIIFVIIAPFIFPTLYHKVTWGF